MNVGLEVLQETEIRLHWWSEMFFLKALKKGLRQREKT